MKAYNPEKPLFSLHVPKCAGQSFRSLLQHWFGDRFFIHYFQQNGAMPPRHSLAGGACVHGHFNRAKGMGVEAYYPGAEQFITILRDPLEVAISNYFFWKRKARQRQIERGAIRAGSEDDYRGIDDFFRKRPRSHMLNFLPGPLSRENYREILDRHFVWIGLVDHLDDGAAVLAERLGFPPRAIGRVNASPRDEDLSPERRQEFMRRNELEFEIFRAVREMWPETGVRRRIDERQG